MRAERARKPAEVAPPDEISAVDVIIILRRRWIPLLIGIALGIIAATVYGLSNTPYYESRATFRIGKVQELGLIDDFDAVKAQLLGQRASSDVGVYLREVNRLSREGDLLEIVAVARAPAEAQQVLQRTVDKLLERHEELYSAAIRPLEDRVARIEQDIEAMNAQLVQFDEIIASVKNSRPEQASLAAIERAQLYPILAELERDRIELQRQLTRPYSSPSLIIARPTLPGSPASAGTAVYVAAGVVLGAILGLLAALISEFLAKLRARNLI